MEAQSPELVPDVKSSSQSDLLAARREARRKRILENSNDRLTKITGREHNEPPAEDFTVKPPEVIYPDPEDERDEYMQPEWEPFAAAAPERFPMSNDDVFSLLNLGAAQNGSIPTQPQPPGPERVTVKLLRTRVHLAVMAIAIYLLFATEKQHLIGGNVFTLLLGWEMVEVFLLKTYETSSSFLSIIFLLGGISTKYSQIIIKFMETINKVLKDVTFFVFFFVMTHLLWCRLVLGLELGQVLGYGHSEKDPS